jgi:hypothetical protein
MDSKILKEKNLISDRCARLLYGLNSRTSMYNLRKKHNLAYFQIGRKIFYERDALIALIRANRRKAAAPKARPVKAA